MFLSLFVARRYKWPHRQKLIGPVLDRVYEQCVDEQQTFLTSGSKHGGYGRAVTGDGCTIMGTKFINTLVHEFGKGAMLLHIVDCTLRLQESGTIDSKFITDRLINSIKVAGPKRVVLVIVDGGADWVATKAMVQDSYYWISFMHCTAHEASLIVKDICQIDLISELITWVADAQHWFSTSKVGPLLQRFCLEFYDSTRAFVWPAETRFADKILQLKRFLSLKQALKCTVLSAQYERFNFEGDNFKTKILGDGLWSLLNEITCHAGPLLLLLRLADSNAATLSKLKGTVEYLKTKYIDSGRDTLQDKIAVAFINRAPELECDISSAAYILDPQFVFKSRNAPKEVMDAFWRVARKVLRLIKEDEWNTVRPAIVAELSNFRMKTAGFVKENYNMPDACAFWGVAGCHAPNLKKIAFLLCSLPCSSGAAERNWKEVKLTYTKTRNRLSKEKLIKMVFVRRFLKVKLKICNNDSNDGFAEWVNDMLQKLTAEESSSSSSSESDDSTFRDYMEPGEQLKVNGMRGGKRVVLLTDLKKDNLAKGWLFHKYYNMHFVDKNPDTLQADAEPLEEGEWEHRVIKDITWSRGKGWAAETFLKDCFANQSIEPYHINENLHQMIRDSPHNVRPLFSGGGDDSGDGDDTEDENTCTDTSTVDSQEVAALFD